MPVAISSGGPGLVKALGLTLVAGRDFLQADVRGSDPVVIINLAAAHSAFGDESPLGRSVTLPGASRPSRIVGVVQDATYVSLRSERPPTIYCLEDLPSNVGQPDLVLVVRGGQAPESLKLDVAKVVASNFPPLSSLELVTGREALAAQLRDQAFGATVSSWYGAMALLIALLGVQSSVAVMIASRRRELAIRLALGATRGRVLRFVSGHTLQPVAFGILIGLVIAAFAAQVWTALLFGTAPFDWPSYGAVAAGVIGLAGLQALVAARPVLKLDPACALRSEDVS
jgi:ABC-type antimicrobial peptide transport system permease subunit